MTQPQHILLLAGSAEAQRVAEGLSQLGLMYSVWLSEPPRGVSSLPQKPVLQQFETVHEMQACIAAGGYSAIVDASHGFDLRMTQQSFAAAAALGLPYLNVARPAWDLSAVPRCQAVADVQAAIALIAQGDRVFCTTGWDSLGAMAAFRGDVLMLRQTRHHTQVAPYPFVQLVFGDPPFSVAQEAALFEKHRISTLIFRNIGGQASRPKLDAAVALGLRAIAIERPAPPAGVPQVFDAQSALDWIATL